MIVYELPFEFYERVSPLFADAPFDEACFESVFLGWQTARIFVDDFDTPLAAMMCRSYEYFLAGDPTLSAELCQFISDAPPEVGVFQYTYGMVPLNSAWQAALLEAHPLETIGRLNFRWQLGTPIPTWRDHVPPEAQIVVLDRALAERVDRDKQIFPVPFTRLFWSEYDRYDAHGYGVALMIDDAFASVALAVSVSPRDAILSIDTAYRFQRRGYAKLVGAAFIEETLRQGLLPVWDCDDFNEASIKLARGFGFVEQQPFVELAIPGRRRPKMRDGLWHYNSSRADGIIVWRRIEKYE